MGNARAFLAIAAVSALAAVAVVAAVAFQTPTGRPIAAVSRAFSRTHNARVQYMSAAQQPVVYYYLPEKAASKVTHATVAMLNETDANATSAGAGDDSKFVCTLANIKALSAKVQSEWDKCKAADDYVEPNKDARRRLLGWVWEPDQEPKTAMPQHPPTYYKLRLGEADRRKSRVMHRAAMLDEQMLDAAADNATNATNATATGSEKNLLADCEHKALGPACEWIASCANPVCESYYNDPEVEALCGMCTMGAGCFAHAAEVYTKDRGPVQISELTVGDKVLAATAEGSVVSSEVIFMHDHKDSSTTVRVEVAGNVMELTPAHMVATYTPACAGAYCAAAKLLPAREVRVGDRIYVADGDSTAVKAVTGVSSAVSKVRYVVTADDTIVVNGVVAPVYSTAAKGLETLPFHMLHAALPGVLQWTPVATALEQILESPALRFFESLVNLSALKTKYAVSSAAAAKGLSVVAASKPSMA